MKVIDTLCKKYLEPRAYLEREKYLCQTSWKEKDEEKYVERVVEETENKDNSGGPSFSPIPISIAVVGDFKCDHMMRAAKNMVFSLTIAQPETRAVDEFVRQVHARCIHHEAEETPMENVRAVSRLTSFVRAR